MTFVINMLFIGLLSVGMSDIREPSPSPDGETTYGAVIGTSDVTLVDGTGFRVPSTGWYTLTGENLENSGVEPDIHVPELPANAGQNIDRQLEAAAAAILELI